MKPFSLPRLAADHLAMLLSVERARTLLESVHGPAGHPLKRSPYHHARSTQWKAAVVAGVSCLAAMGDESDASLMADALELLRQHESDYNPLLRDARSCVVSYVKRLPPTSAAVRTLAEHSCVQVRCAVAEGLHAHHKDPEGWKALLALARDHSPMVRHAAREAAPKDALDRWHGLFSSDPVEDAVAWAKKHAPKSPDKAEKNVRSLLERIYDLFTKESWEPSEEETLVAHWELLPDPLVLDLVRHVAALDRHAKPSPLVSVVVDRKGGAELVIELTCRWARTHEHFLAHRVAQLLEAPRLVAARRKVGELAAREACSPLRSATERKVLAELVLETLAHDLAALGPWVIEAAPGLSSNILYSWGAPSRRPRRPRRPRRLRRP